MKNTLRGSNDERVNRRKRALKKHRFTPGLMAIFFLPHFLISPLHAEIPEPDNIVYGAIVIGGQPVTAAQTDVVIEARRTIGGTAISSYRMGSDSRLGNFYSLDLKFETFVPINDADSSQAGDTLYLVVKQGGAIVEQTTYQFPERGHVQRIDFGVPLDDTDGNGLPDAWELAMFGSGGQNPDIDHDLDGRSTGDEYIAGTNPNDPNDVFDLTISQVGTNVRISFPARQAQGPGYVGKTREYSLETRTTIDAPDWSPLPGFNGIVATNQTVTLQQQVTNVSTFYRAKVSLRSP
jgi:hypothetical protein